MSASPATALLVLGMHRSGTSALTAVLNDLGASLGNELVAANDDNPGGYFENAGAVTAHEMLLAELDRGWEDLRELPEGWLQSAAGKRAQAGIAALLREEFAGVPLWALKDPRLCRLLPLWRPALAEAGIEAKALFVLRNPDEVAASLGKRDGIGAEIAHLLWLRHFLDAERDSRGLRRCVLTYEALLDDPVGSLRRVGESLDIAWPHPPEADRMSRLLDSGQRHHRPMPEAGAEGPRKAALDLYRAATTGTGWPDGGEQRALLEEWSRRLAPWLDGAGDALARARRDGLLALQRCMDAEAALEEAKALSLSRLGELQGLAARLEATDAALEEAKALSLSRLGELQGMSARLEVTNAALEEAKALSLSRLGELQALTTRLESTDVALEEAKALSLSRMDELRVLYERLQRTDAALEETKALSLSRLAEVQALDRRAVAIEADLASTRADAQARQERDAATIAALEARARAAEAGLRELLASHSWRITAPLRWLARRLGRGGNA